MKKSMTLQAVIRPTMLATLVAASFGAMAADRIELSGAGAVQNRSVIGASAKAHEALGLGVSDLTALRSQKYGNKVVTRFEQSHKGVPVWGEAIVEHLDTTQSLATSAARSFHGAMLNNLANDLPSVRPLYSSSQALGLIKNAKRPGNSYNEQAKLFVKQGADGTAKLVYLTSFVTIAADGTPSRPYAFIDANTGAILEQWEGITHLDAGGPGGNQRIGRLTRCRVDVLRRYCRRARI